MVKARTVHRSNVERIAVLLWFALLSLSHAAPPAHAEWQLTFSDEFDGEGLDWEVWESQSSSRGQGKLEGRWPENNVVRGGHLHQVTKRETPPRGGKGWSTAHIIARHVRQQYGYFEARMRYGPYLNNAFWLYRPPGARFPEPPHFEIDINEGHTPNQVNMCLHFFVDVPEADGEVMFSRGRHWTAEENLANDFHIYACEWSEKEIVWWMDGRPIRRLENPNCHAPADVRLSTIILPRALERDGVDPATMDGVSMVIDWVRVYRKVRDLNTPKRSDALPLEPCPVPTISETAPTIPLEGTRQAVFAASFEKGAVPPGRWIWADGSPAIVPARDAPRSSLVGGGILELEPGDYAYALLPRPLNGRVEVVFDAWSSTRRDGLLFVTLGDFDQEDPAQRASSYHTGDIGPYIHWRKIFIQHYTEDRKWQPFAYNTGKRWRRYRVMLNVEARRFDLYCGEEGAAFVGGGPFRGSQRAIHGIGFRQRGSQGTVYVDNITVNTLVP